MGKKLDLKGKTFTNWTVLYEAGKDSKGRTLWMCRCKCGTEKLVIGSNLNNGNSKSCGCFQKETKGPQWTGIGELSGEVFSRIQKGALSRNIEFNLTKEYIWNLFLKQDRKCAISGLEITFPPTNETRDSYLKTASLDRIDSTRPYEEGNVQWVHKHINIMKNVFVQDYFIELCSIITRHNLENNEECEITKI